jgi:hypothetical protein
MSKSNPSFCASFCSRSALSRLILISGLLLVCYLFMLKFDIDITTQHTRNLLIPTINLNQRNVRNLSITPIPITNITLTTTSSEKNDKIVQIITTKDALTNQSNTKSQNTSTFDQPKEAFVTFSNNHPSYLALLKVLLDSVHAFSTRPIIAFGIDVDLDIDVKQYPRVIKRRIQQSDCGPVRYHQMYQHKTKQFLFIIF